MPSISADGRRIDARKRDELTAQPNDSSPSGGLVVPAGIETRNHPPAGICKKYGAGRWVVLGVGARGMVSSCPRKAGDILQTGGRLAGKAYLSLQAPEVPSSLLSGAVAWLFNILGASSSSPRRWPFNKRASRVGGPWPAGPWMWCGVCHKPAAATSQA